MIGLQSVRIILLTARHGGGRHTLGYGQHQNMPLLFCRAQLTGSGPLGPSLRRITIPGTIPPI